MSKLKRILLIFVVITAFLEIIAYFVSINTLPELPGCFYYGSALGVLLLFFHYLIKKEFIYTIAGKDGESVALGECERLIKKLLNANSNIGSGLTGIIVFIPIAAVSFLAGIAFNIIFVLIISAMTSWIFCYSILLIALNKIYIK